MNTPTPDAAPASSLLLIHGAGSGPWVFDDGVDSVPSLGVATVDLLEGLDPTSASMTDYAEQVVTAATVRRSATSQGSTIGISYASGACAKPWPTFSAPFVP